MFVGLEVPTYSNSLVHRAIEASFWLLSSVRMIFGLILTSQTRSDAQAGGRALADPNLSHMIIMEVAELLEGHFFQPRPDMFSVLSSSGACFDLMDLIFSVKLTPSCTTLIRQACPLSQVQSI